MAIRKVNAITGRGCAEAQEASRDGQLPASGLHGTAATGGERDGIRQRNTSAPNAPDATPAPAQNHGSRVGSGEAGPEALSTSSLPIIWSHPDVGISAELDADQRVLLDRITSLGPERRPADHGRTSGQINRGGVHTDKKRMSGMPLRFLAAGAVQPAVDSPASAKAAGSLIFSIPDGCARPSLGAARRRSA